MESIEVNIMQYQQSIERVRQRIEWLNAEIDKARRSGHAIKEFLDRRVTLYVELSDLQYALGSLQEYQQQIQAREGVAV